MTNELPLPTSCSASWRAVQSHWAAAPALDGVQHEVLRAGLRGRASESEEGNLVWYLGRQAAEMGLATTFTFDLVEGCAVILGCRLCAHAAVALGSVMGLKGDLLCMNVVCSGQSSSIMVQGLQRSCTGPSCRLAVVPHSRGSEHAHLWSIRGPTRWQIGPPGSQACLEPAQPARQPFRYSAAPGHT